MALPKRIYLYPFLFIAIWLLAGCNGCSKSGKTTNWFLDMERLSKNPYSLYLTYESLPLLFPGTTTEKLKGDYRLTNLGYQLRKNEGKSLLLMIGMGGRFADGEIDSLFSFVQEGHQVLLSANRFEEALLKRLHLVQAFQPPGSDNKAQQLFLKDKNSVLQPYPYRYRDHNIYGYFESKDTVNAPFHILGTNGRKRPDCIVYTIGKGRLIVHAAPMAFTNYFLLQQDNRQYLANLFSYVPEKLSNVYFCSYNYRSIAQSDWSVIWRNKATRAALLLSLLVLLLFILFEMKRRQKIIPVIAPVENSSVAFVETIGRLYYNKKNHTNLSEKIVQHFLDFVRNNYYLNTNQLDDEFVRHLAAKSGNDISRTDTLVYTIKEVQRGIKADEAFLYSLYNQIQQFYNGK